MRRSRLRFNRCISSSVLFMRCSCSDKCVLSSLMSFDTLNLNSSTEVFIAVTSVLRLVARSLNLCTSVFCDDSIWFWMFSFDFWINFVRASKSVDDILRDLCWFLRVFDGERSCGEPGERERLREVDDVEFVRLCEFLEFDLLRGFGCVGGMPMIYGYLY